MLDGCNLDGKKIRCAWVIPAEDPDARYMVPGCWERLEDPEADCTCKTSAEEIDEALEKIRKLEQDFRDLQNRHCSLISVVGRAPGGPALLEAAEQQCRITYRTDRETDA